MQTAQLIVEGITGGLAAHVCITSQSRTLPPNWGGINLPAFGCKVPEFRGYMRWFKTEFLRILWLRNSYPLQLLQACS